MAEIEWVPFCGKYWRVKIYELQLISSLDSCKDLKEAMNDKEKFNALIIKKWGYTIEKAARDKKVYIEKRLKKRLKATDVEQLKREMLNSISV